ncbi:MAG: glycosyltransferase family 9 protein [Thermodesulfovibrionales bacterium]
MRLKHILKRPALGLLFSLGKLLKNAFNKPVDKNDIRNVLILQTGGIGDVLRIFPVVEAISREMPAAAITTLTEHGNELFTLYDTSGESIKHIVFDFNGGYLHKLSQIRQLRKLSFDLILSPSRGDGIMECSIIAWLIGAPHRIGFYQGGGGFLYTCKTEFREDISILDQNIALLLHLGIKSQTTNISLAISQRDIDYASDFIAKNSLDGSFIITIHPWASSFPESRMWPVESYRKLINSIIARQDCRIVLLGGKGEMDKAKALATGMGKGLFDLTGGLTIAQTAALISKSNIFIGNDSSLLHIANALMVPSICIFGSTSSKQVLSQEHNCVPVSCDISCRPCYLHQPLFRHRCDHQYRCLHLITPDIVKGILESLLLKSGKKSGSPAE